MDAVIVNIPRMAPSRPSAGTALIKSLLNNNHVSNQLVDINIDFFNRFAVQYGAEQFQELHRKLLELALEFLEAILSKLRLG